MKHDFGYDLETYVNCFVATFVHIPTGTRWIFEISARRNQSFELFTFLDWIESLGARGVGFNNVGFDYVVLHYFRHLVKSQGYATAEQLHDKGASIIASDRFGSIIWPNERFFPQLDLYLINHFDNVAKATSLKVLEFNMNSPTIKDLPFPPDQHLTSQEMDIVVSYNCHDVAETVRFYHYCRSLIEFRDEMTAKLGEDFTNFNDTKIGKQYFINELEKESPGICFDRSSGRKEPRQTHRSHIPLDTVIFPYVTFKTPEFSRVLNYLKTVSITDTKGAPELKDLNATIRGFRFDFGTGGIHGSLTGATIRADAEHEILDVDVASYYPNLAIKNKLFPQHLSETFCRIYEDLYNRRKSYPKKSSESAMLKLALNGVYGDSNNIYSPFYDPAYTMAITINGQLLLCMLAEWLMESPHIEMIQANTDGLTVRCHRDGRAWFDQCYQAWQIFTQLELETVKYSAMFIRDVNNYMAESVDGKVKRIGAYAYETQAENPATRELWWNKDWSSRVVAKAVEAVLLRGADLETFIRNHPEPADFMIRVKVPRSSRLVAQWSNGDQPLQNTTRYHIATAGPHLFKVMPALGKKIAAGDATPRRMAVDKGWPVRVCNDVQDWSWELLDRSYYVAEARKLMEWIK